MPIYAISHHKGGAGKTTSTVHIVGELKPDITIDLGKVRISGEILLG